MFGMGRHGSARIRQRSGKRVRRRWARLPFLQGHRAATGAIRALVEAPGLRARGSVPNLPLHPGRSEGAPALARALRARSMRCGAGRVARTVRRAAARGAGGRVTPATGQPTVPGFPVAVEALAPELPHKAKLGGVRLGVDGIQRMWRWRPPTCCGRARRAGAAASACSSNGWRRAPRWLIGAVVDGSFGACVREGVKGGVLVEAGVGGVRRRRPGPCAGPRVRPHARGEACALTEDRHDLRAVARAVEAIARAAHDLRHRLTSLEANPLLVGERGAVAVDAVGGSRASGVIYGLVAAFWASAWRTSAARSSWPPNRRRWPVSPWSRRTCGSSVPASAAWRVASRGRWSRRLRSASRGSSWATSRQQAGWVAGPMGIADGDNW